MKTLIISDTHGIQKNMDWVFAQERQFAQVIHLGDIEGDEDYLEAAAGCPVAAVRGNNDYFSDLLQEQMIEIEGKQIFLTHGHYYYVAAGVEHLMKEAKGRGADIVMFGHTHRPLICREGNMYVINPGSLSYPRQEGRKPSYIVMETGFYEQPKFFLKFL